MKVTDRNKTAEYRGETPTLMVYSGQINETTTLCLPKEEQWSQFTEEDHDFRYIKIV